MKALKSILAAALLLVSSAAPSLAQDVPANPDAVEPGLLGSVVPMPTDFISAPQWHIWRLPITPNLDYGSYIKMLPFGISYREGVEGNYYADARPPMSWKVDGFYDAKQDGVTEFRIDTDAGRRFAGKAFGYDEKLAFEMYGSNYDHDDGMDAYYPRCRVLLEVNGKAVINSYVGGRVAGERRKRTGEFFPERTGKAMVRKGLNPVHGVVTCYDMRMFTGFLRPAQMTDDILDGGFAPLPDDFVRASYSPVYWRHALQSGKRQVRFTHREDTSQEWANDRFFRRVADTPAVVDGLPADAIYEPMPLKQGVAPGWKAEYAVGANGDKAMGDAIATGEKFIHRVIPEGRIDLGQTLLDFVKENQIGTSRVFLHATSNFLAPYSGQYLFNAWLSDEPIISAAGHVSYPSVSQFGGLTEHVMPCAITINIDGASMNIANGGLLRRYPYFMSVNLEKGKVAKAEISAVCNLPDRAIEKSILPRMPAIDLVFRAPGQNTFHHPANNFVVKVQAPEQATIGKPKG